MPLPIGCGTHLAYFAASQGLEIVREASNGTISPDPGFGQGRDSTPERLLQEGALARYGGLRVPSEALQLRRGDIHWDQGRFTVTSPKTEHHEGHATRQVPLFPELLPHLHEAFDQAGEGAEFCITRSRDQKVNLRRRLQRIIKRAGLKPWPKLWQNLRSTRETELADQFPAHVAAAWIGNSVAVAVKHYLQVTEDHFKQAANKATQNPTSKAHESSRNDSKTQRPSEAPESVSSSDCERL